MKFASTVHNGGVVASLNFDSVLLKTSSISSPNWLRLHFSPPTSLVAGGFICSPRKNLVITRSRKTDPDAEKSVSEEVITSRQTRDSIIDTKGSYKVSSSDDSEKGASGPDNYVTSVRTVALCVLSAVVFGVGLGFKDGAGKASEFFAGYLLEQSLSVDNLFVFVLIFKYFKVPLMYQNRVLSYGIAGAIVFRLSLILLGTATIQKFEAVNLLFAAILLFSAFKLFMEDGEDTELSDNFVVKTCQKIIPVTSTYDDNRFITIQDGIWKATPLLLTVAVIELSDIAFAVDSIPAVFGVTRDPFVVFTSNLFAILGLRSLYTLISESMGELEYLQPAIAIVLGFIGSKMILDFFGYHISTEVSLGVVATCLSGGVLLSLLKKSD